MTKDFKYAPGQVLSLSARLEPHIGSGLYFVEDVRYRHVRGEEPSCSYWLVPLTGNTEQGLSIEEETIGELIRPITVDQLKEEASS